MRHYVLDEDNNPVREYDLVRWALLFSEQDRRIRLTIAWAMGHEDSKISTVFLGLDHSMGDEGPPILYETMVFGGELDQQCQRYSTLQEALDGHNEMCGLVQESLLVKE